MKDIIIKAEKLSTYLANIGVEISGHLIEMFRQPLYVLFFFLSECIAHCFLTIVEFTEILQYKVHLANAISVEVDFTCGIIFER